MTRQGKELCQVPELSIMSGLARGAFSDGKYNITNDFGGHCMNISASKAIELMEYVDEINMKYGGRHKDVLDSGHTLKEALLQNKLNSLTLPAPSGN